MDTETEAAMIIRNITRYEAMRLSCKDMASLEFVDGVIDKAKERLSELEELSLRCHTSSNFPPALNC